MQRLINIAELAEILGRSTETIKKNLQTCPQAVPPRVLIPRTRMLRWRVTDVEQWISELPSTHDVALCRNRDDQ